MRSRVSPCGFRVLLPDFVVDDVAKEAMLTEATSEEATCVDHHDLDERRLRVSRPDGKMLGKKRAGLYKASCQDDIETIANDMGN